MSTLVDVPACLFAVLSLAASGADATRLGELAPVAAGVRGTAAESGAYPMSDAIWLRAWMASTTVDGLGLPEAPRVYVTSSGHYYVPGDGAREKLLGLRRDDDLAKRVAFGFAKRNAGQLEIALGRAPVAEELYVAHRFGPETAASFIVLASEKPKALLAAALPDVARLAPELATEGGRASTVARAYERLAEAFAAARPDGFVLAAPPPAAPPHLTLIDGLGAGLVIAMHGDVPSGMRGDAQPASSPARPWAADVVAAGN